ncbi:interferon regulatory factor 7 [Neopsephotus bourkii]|uniref:interferon regulatory factor 7 n=1 Tax=Neopsephotus bourkii TaxID=309878 RepID=UPI002AA5197E|nr:interferon regulatory factor 7 [Neopsephotus bourkii]
MASDGRPRILRDAPKLRFVPWLLNAVTSGIYQGLCWTDRDRGAFRVPWKHNSRKDVTSSDREIFKEWARVSGRYEEYPENPVKWKTNFRCALKSTRMFVELEDHSKCGDDPHKVFAINRDLWHGKADFSSPNPVADQQALHQQLQLQFDPQDVAPEIAPLGCADPLQPSLLEELQLVLQHCGIFPSDLGPPTPSWAPAGDAPQQNIVLQPHPDLSQNNCLQPPPQQWVPPVEQPPLGAYSPPDPMLLGQQGAVTLPCHQPEVPIPVPTAQEVMLLTAAATAPVPPLENNTGDLDVSIYYRGKLVHQEEVAGSRCLLVYQSSDPAVAGRAGSLVHFPSPARLPDRKQLWFTEELLRGAGLQLEHRGHKLFATRLKQSRVFWALSRQLEGIGDLPPNPLVRNQETPIFDFTEFCTELREFRTDRRKQSPDFTIYLCFGQSLSVAKPKKSKLILVKLVPKFCEYWYEQVLREGASSLDSGTVSLQLSDSFSLFELIEQYNMQLD